MSEPGGSDGWAPLDPDLNGAAHRPQRPEPPPQAPHAPEPRPYQGPYAPGPYGQYGQHEQYGQYGEQGPYGPYGRYGQPYGGGYAPPAPFTTSRTEDAPPGAPFHRLARNPPHRWWRPLAGSLVIVAGGMGLAVVVMIIGMIVRTVVEGGVPDTDSDSVFGNDTADLAFDLGSLALFLPVALFAAWGLQRRRPGTLSSVAGRLRWRWMLACCGLAVLFCIVSFGASIVAGAAVDDQSSGDEHWVGWGRFLAPAIVILLLVPFQSAAEEYVFRGWLLQAVGACTLEDVKGRVGRAFSVVFRTPWPGIVVGSALFTSGHGYTGWGILDIFFFGAVAAWLAVKTGGLESSIALHVFNNLMAFLLPAAVGELDIEQGGVPWQVVAADIAPMALYAATVVWLARRMKIQTVTAGPEDDDVPVTPPPHPTPVS
ncbi:type II CAAX prenyl endopeptidase Rce1 family protein [Actinomadura syzygii]|uniref:CPBP family intramembrane metalloprotease n=1 Tax=Actinomadura syzygii TaxID=1427538 RepID=A0A5D0U6Q3_9ACTN|nr:CPBP family glutamic-type intramembrane protease [Actinomadura syzygii]TYC13777.1 CPBP family intramembrane metalloprotease [Actinomadura syzygii]